MFNLIEFENIKYSFDGGIISDIHEILLMMRKENISLENWQLVEIPTESTYCFFNPISSQAFDVELDDSEVLKPHYYDEKENTTITKFPTTTIKESMRRFSLS